MSDSWCVWKVNKVGCMTEPEEPRSEIQTGTERRTLLIVLPRLGSIAFPSPDWQGVNKQKGNDSTQQIKGYNKRDFNRLRYLSYGMRVNGVGGLFFACEDSGRTFDQLFPAWAFFKEEISTRTISPLLGQDQSTVAQRAETTMAERSLKCSVISFPHGFQHYTWTAA